VLVKVLEKEEKQTTHQPTMTNNLKIGNVKIFSTLEDDPHVASSLPSEMDVQDAASSLIPGQSSTPFGLVVECSH
jgi:hypothetical protein